jgi:hypothetical protein
MAIMIDLPLVGVSLRWRCQTTLKSAWKAMAPSTAIVPHAGAVCQPRPSLRSGRATQVGRSIQADAAAGSCVQARTLLFFPSLAHAELQLPTALGLGAHAP